MLKEEALVHYEASFCYDAYQFCVLVRLQCFTSTVNHLDFNIGIGFPKCEEVDSTGLGSVVCHFRTRQQCRPDVQNILRESTISSARCCPTQYDTIRSRPSVHTDSMTYSAHPTISDFLIYVMSHIFANSYVLIHAFVALFLSHVLDAHQYD